MLVLDDDGTVLDADDEAVKFYGYGDVPLKSESDITDINDVSRRRRAGAMALIRDGGLDRYESTTGWHPGKYVRSRFPLQKSKLTERKGFSNRYRHNRQAARLRKSSISDAR